MKLLFLSITLLLVCQAKKKGSLVAFVTAKSGTNLIKYLGAYLGAQSS
jgi:hypothetical protein